MPSIKPSFILSKFVLCRTFCKILSCSSPAAVKDGEVNSRGKTLPQNGNGSDDSFTNYWQVYNARFITQLRLGTGWVNKRCFGISLSYSSLSMWPWLLPLWKQRRVFRYKTTKGEEKKTKQKCLQQHLWYMSNQCILFGMAPTPGKTFWSYTEPNVQKLYSTVHSNYQLNS